MNKNFLNVMYPSLPPVETHYIKPDTQVISTTLEAVDAPIGKIDKLSGPNIKFINDKTPCILLEEGLGYNTEWSKVLINTDNIVYVKSENISLIRSSYILSFIGIPKYQEKFFPYSTEKKYSANPNAPEINWLEQKVNIPYINKRTGNMCVSIQFDDITKLTSKQDSSTELRNILKLACFEGTSLILKSKGFNYDAAYVTNLVNNFYIFSRAEEYYFSDNPCSPIKIYVTLPLRYLYAIGKDGEYILDVNYFAIEDSISKAAVIKDFSVPDEPLPKIIGEGGIPLAPDVPEVYKIVYNNKEEMDQHFAYILLTLANYTTIFNVPPGRIWNILPEDTPNRVPFLGSLNLIAEQGDLALMFREINEFIQNNLFEGSILYKKPSTDGLDGNEPLGLANYKRVLGLNLTDIVSIQAAPEGKTFNLTDIIASLTTGKGTSNLDYKGRIELYIDKNNLKFKDVKIYTSGNVVREIPLNINKDQFLSSEILQNKTSLNYLIQKDLKPSEIFSKAAKEASEYFNLNPNLTVIGGILEKLGNAASDAFKAASSVIEVNKDQQLETFFIKYHYPSIISIYSEPIDFSACVDKYGTTFEQKIDTLKKAALPENKLKQYNKLIKDVKKQQQAKQNPFLKSLTDTTNLNPSVKLLLGIEKPKGTKEEQIKQLFKAANLLDWGGFLEEAITCSSTKFNPRDWINLINDYQNAKELVTNPSLLLLCNPFLDKVLKEISAFELPTVPTYDPNNSISKQLEELALDILNELMVFGIRALITGSIKNCTDNRNDDTPNNARSNPNDVTPEEISPDDLAAKIDTAQDTANIENLFKDVFNIKKQEDGETPESNDLLLKQAKAILKQFLDDVLPCLTTRELCLLLTGQKLNDDVYEVIFSILRKKYNTPDKKINLYEKLSNIKEITEFFTKFSTAYNLQICDDILTDRIEIPKNPLCDIGIDEKLRKSLLDKNISEELIDNLLEEKKKKDILDTQKLLDFLNRDNPFDLSNIPTVLCKKGPNGEVIPPAVSIAPSIKTFGSMLDTLYKSAYDNFDSEAPRWYESTYTEISEESKNHLSFDNNGNIVVNPSIPTSHDKKKANPKKSIKIPNYVLNKTFNDNKIICDGLSNSYIAEISGSYVRNVELSVISNSDVLLSNTFEYNLKDFIFKYMQLLDLYRTYVNNNQKDPLLNDATLTDDVKYFINNTIPVFNHLCATYYLNNTAVLDNDVLRSKIINIAKFKDKDISNAFFFNEIGIPTYKIIRDTYTSNSYFTDNFKKFISSVKTGIQDKYTSVITLEADCKTFIESNQSNQFVDSRFTSLLKAKNKYPDYYLKISDNSYEVYNTNTNANQAVIKQLRMFNNVEIQKNNLDYINFSSTTVVDDKVLYYLTNKLNYSEQQIKNKSKEQILNDFIDNKKIQFPDSQYVNGKQVNILTQSLNIKSEIKDNKLVITNFFDDYASKSEVNRNFITKFSDIKYQLTNKIINEIQSKDNLFNQLQEKVKTDTKNQKAEANFKAGSGDGQFGDLRGDIPTDDLGGGSTTYTNYLSNALVIKQTPIQKTCNVRPHYLDIDSIKSDTVKEKAESYCLEEIKNEKALNGESITTNELSKIDPTETESIMLNGGYRLLIRTYIHDYLLRGIALFGVYDPQSIRNNNVFIDYITSQFEADMRAADNTLFLMIVNFYLQMYVRQNRQNNINVVELPNYKKILRDIIKDELKFVAIPKLAKRIDIDTNRLLRNLIPSKKILLKSLVNYYNSNDRLFVIDPTTKSVYLRISGYNLTRETVIERGNGSLERTTSLISKTDFDKVVSETQNNFKIFGNSASDLFNLNNFNQEIYYRKIYQSYVTPNDIQTIANDFYNSEEFALLFEFLFPYDLLLTSFYITSVLSTNSNKDNTKKFNDTKKYLRMLVKKMAVSGNDIRPDQNNFQDVQNSDNSFLFIQFILKSLITAPLKIVKGYVELTEPNVALSSKLYMLAKSLQPQVSSVMIPAISIPLAIPLPIAPLGLIPWINIPLVISYMALGIWYDDGKMGEEDSTLLEEIVNSLINGETAQEFDCSNVKNQDLITEDKREILSQDNSIGYKVLNKPANI